MKKVSLDTWIQLLGMVGLLGAGKSPSAELKALLAAAGVGKLRVSIVQLLFSAACASEAIITRPNREELRINRKYACMVTSFS